MRKINLKPSQSKPAKWKVGSQKKNLLVANFPLIMAIGWFLGIIAIYTLYQFTYISLVELLKWYALFSLGLTLIPYKYILKVIYIHYTQLIAINIIGIGPFLTGLFLVLNFLFSSDPRVETYKIAQTRRCDSPWEKNLIEVVLENNALENPRRFRQFDEAYFIDFTESDSITFHISTGFFGYEVLKDYELK